MGASAAETDAAWTDCPPNAPCPPCHISGYRDCPPQPAMPVSFMSRLSLGGLCWVDREGGIVAWGPLTGVAETDAA